ncbi:MAG: sigma-70 family RNA polymerase sigma factor [Acidobacteria bacterium]|nr:MAG: sigma-70 family RNA polymerase sigma factor [Acidobacteriota bacterium]
MSAEAGEITLLLRAWQQGEEGAFDRLAPLVYEDLRRIAQRALRGERAAPTLQATALVHEAFLRLSRQSAVDWQERQQLYGVAAHMMRRILVDHARARRAAKRTAPEAWTLSESSVAPRGADLLALDLALQKLAAMDAEKCRLVELRYFAGLTVEEAAEVLGISSRSVARQWTWARAWLYGELEGGCKAAAAEGDAG